MFLSVSLDVYYCMYDLQVQFSFNHGFPSSVDVDDDACGPRGRKTGMTSGWMKNHRQTGQMIITARPRELVAPHPSSYLLFSPLVPANSNESGVRCSSQPFIWWYGSFNIQI